MTLTPGAASCKNSDLNRFADVEGSCRGHWLVDLFKLWGRSGRQMAALLLEDRDGQLYRIKRVGTDNVLLKIDSSFG